MLRMILQPDENLANKKNQEEFSVLNNKKKNITNEMIETMKSEYTSLLEHQNQVQNLDILPSIKLSDISEKVEEVKTVKHDLAHGN